MERKEATEAHHKPWFTTVINDLFGAVEPRKAYAGAGRWSADAYFPAVSRDAILEAGRLQRVMRLVYDGHERLIEPYSLTFKRRKDGLAREYFYAWDRSGGSSRQVGIKAFTADKVQSLDLTDESFDPRFPIELAKTEDGGYFGRPFSGPATSGRRAMPATRRTSSGYGNTYTIQCPFCDKKFKRTTYDTKQNEHKDGYGNRCYGRVGYLV